jgi:hypothetical protein
MLFLLALTLYALACAAGGNNNGMTASAGGGIGGSGGADAGPIPCVRGSDCTVLADTCNTGACLNNVCVRSPTSEGIACDDGLYCTVNDVCTMGVCTGVPRVCAVTADGGADPCHTGTCNEAAKTCVPMPANNGAMCTPTDPCFKAGECAGGACVGTTAVDCSFLSTECSTGVCDGVGSCKSMPDSDGTPCNTKNPNPCVPSACKAGVCTPDPLPDGTACNDKLPCATGVCMAGLCKAQKLPDGSPCTLLFMAPCTAGQCMNGSCQSVPADEGGPCDDGNPCTSNDACQAGICVGGQTLPNKSPCNDGLTDPCTTGECMTGSCQAVPANDGAVCDDGLFCTINDMCKAGTCTGTPNPCTYSGGCVAGTCDMALQQCVTTKAADGTPCDDGDVCNSGKSCKSGFCQGGTAHNNGMACTPAMSCDVGTTCNSGMCSGGTGPTIYFQEEFNDNSKGWTLDMEWEIGAAAPSTCQITGNSDPATDFPMTPANGVGGVVLGGCASTSTTHPPRYLTSPPFDTSMATGSVIFGFYRWLNSEPTPDMRNYVDVYDGTAWQNLWTSGTSFITDSSWMYVSYDVTAFKNAKMRVRFGFDVGSQFVISVSSWNVDNVLVASAKCP